jgi:hypothetical protein
MSDLLEGLIVTVTITWYFAKASERLSVSKRMVTMKNKFAALENLDDNGDISRAWESIRENIRISAKEGIRLCASKSYKPWFDEECLKLVV